MRRMVFVIIILCLFSCSSFHLLLSRIMAPLVLSRYNKEISLSVYISEQERIVAISLETYLRGVVAAEMLPGFHIEA